MNAEQPRLRHEFVGMMFAIAIGEVGLQAAALAKAEHVTYFLPAYSHLFLATIVIATSWVGWSASVAPGARQDVRRIFQWEFIVLLLDVILVIFYFILVRTVDFGKDGTPPRIDPAWRVAQWITCIFILFLAWDCITKIVMYLKNRPPENWLRNDGSRIVPTLICLILAWLVWRDVAAADAPHWLSADFALLCLVLLFRSLKDLISGCFPKVGAAGIRRLWRIGVPAAWSALFVCGLTLGMLATTRALPLPLPKQVLDQLSSPISTNCPKTATGLKCP